MSNPLVPETQTNIADHTIKNRIRYIFSVLITVIIGVYLFNGCTMRKAKVYRVGIVSGLEGFNTIADGFIEKMTSLGYIEGKNIEYDYRKLNDDPIEEEISIKKFINDGVDIILAFPSRPAKTAKTLTQGTNIPVVFAGASIEGINLVENQRQPGENITGVRFPTPEMTAKRLEILLDIAPHITRVLIFFDPTYPSYIPARKALDEMANTLDVTLVDKPVSSLNDIHLSLQELEESSNINFDAIFLMPDLITGSAPAWDTIEPFADKHNLPLIGTMEYSLQGTGLFILNSSHYEIGYLAADIVDKILRGTPAGNIPVATPNLNLFINYRQAQKLGLTVPEGLLKQAYKVIR